MEEGVILDHLLNLLEHILRNDEFLNSALDEFKPAYPFREFWV